LGRTISGKYINSYCHKFVKNGEGLWGTLWGMESYRARAKEIPVSVGMFHGMFSRFTNDPTVHQVEVGGASRTKPSKIGDQGVNIKIEWSFGFVRSRRES